MPCKISLKLQMAVRRELIIDECGGAPRRRRQAHVFLIDRLTTHQEKRKRKRGENGLCADPLAKSRFYRRALLSYFLFPFASSFFFFGEAIVARFLAQVNGRKIVA